MGSQHAVVLGGTRGIGLACAAALIADGHAVTVTGRTEANFAAARAALSHSDGTVRTLALDSTDARAVTRELVERGFDIVVINTGVGFSAKLADTTLDDWTRVLDANVTGAFVAMRAAVPRMVERGWGRVVTVGSIAAHEGLRFGAAYSSSKHALLGLTRAVAAEVADTGVTVNMVSPAFVRTDMTAENTQLIVAATGRDVADVERSLGRLTPIGRLLEPGEVAAEVVRFARPEGAQLNGTAVVLDGRAPR